ncbi:MAG: hypothetical protein NXI21_03090 [Alphaproteobacteria bacterium]|nr:hypothetical protein [Alphaproteobacteria bacterium]
MDSAYHSGDRKGDGDAPVAVGSTPQADIELYAIGLYRANGAAAAYMARERARAFAGVGDQEGAAVWEAVARSVQRMSAKAPQT